MHGQRSRRHHPSIEAGAGHGSFPRKKSRHIHLLYFGMRRVLRLPELDRERSFPSVVGQTARESNMQSTCQKLQNAK
jgi:hypothetical protein